MDDAIATAAPPANLFRRLRIKSRQVPISEYRVAATWPPRSEAVNRYALRPIATGRICDSNRLLSGTSTPFSV